MPQSIFTHITSRDPSSVLRAAGDFFARRNSLYAAFVEQESDRHITLRGQGGEEVAIAVTADGPNTLVTGSTYMFDAQLQRFFSTLPPATTVGEAA
ncbi:MAG: hypothetical protein ACT4P7_05170 [Gemmatimonadaceae bacterium]